MNEAFTREAHKKNVIKQDKNFNFLSNYYSNFHKTKKISTTAIIKYNLHVIYMSSSSFITNYQDPGSQREKNKFCHMSWLIGESNPPPFNITQFFMQHSPLF